MMNSLEKDSDEWIVYVQWAIILYSLYLLPHGHGNYAGKKNIYSFKGLSSKDAPSGQALLPH